MAIAMIVVFRKVAFSLEAKEPIIKMVIFQGGGRMRRVVFGDKSCHYGGISNGTVA